LRSPDWFLVVFNTGLSIKQNCVFVMGELWEIIIRKGSVNTTPNPQLFAEYPKTAKISSI